MLDEHFPKIPAEAILSYARLCSCCGQNVNTRSCFVGGCTWLEKEEKYVDLKANVCEDCEVKCIHCDEQVCCPECKDCWAECFQDNWDYPAVDWEGSYGNFVHEDFVCEPCERKYIRESPYKRDVNPSACCVICDAKESCIVCKETKNLTRYKKGFQICEDCGQKADA